MPLRTSQSPTRRARAVLGALTVTTAFLATGVAAITTTASAAPRASATRVADKKGKPKKPSTPVPTTDETPPSGNQTIYEEGSTLLYPLYEEWAPAYHKEYPNITIDPAGGGSGKGVTDAADGVVDIGSSDAYLSSSQVSEYPGLKNIALEISAQMVNYNIPGLSDSVHLKLTGQVLSQIYQGKITEWDNPAITGLNPGVTLPPDNIIALHRSDSSGDTFLFSTFLSDADPSGWGSSIGYGTSIAFPAISNSAGETGNGGMLTACKNTPGSVAYIGISYETKAESPPGPALGIAQLANASGHYELPVAGTIVAEAQALEAKTPTDETLSLIYDNAAGGYPIVNYEYAIIPGKESSPSEAAAVRAFLYWAIDPNKGTSATYLGPVNFQPLTPAVTALSDAQIASISD